MKLLLALLISFSLIPQVSATQLHRAKVVTSANPSESKLEGSFTGPSKPALPASKQTNSIAQSDSSKEITSSPFSDTYSLAPLLQDGEFAYFVADAEQATTHQFDETWKTLGVNQYGTAGSSILVIEKTRDLENGDIQVSIQVTAVNSENVSEPWVDAGFSASAFTTWRLDVGTSLGGSNPIKPDSLFEVTGSGVSLFDAAGENLGVFEINDTSNSSGLSGVALINFTDNSDIAGYDMSSMVMYWNIKIKQTGTDFDVTSGQSGAWYDPAHDGEGFFLQVIDDERALAFWFTYDKSGNQYWMLGVGEINGSIITFPDMQSTHGGKFGPDFDPTDVVREVWGTLEFNFSTCNSATATYVGPPSFGSGSLNITRLTELWGLDCEGNDSHPQSTGTGFLSGGFSGSWFDVDHDGEGFVVEILNETTALVIWFTYDRNGNQVWMLNTGVIDGATIIVDDLLITSGGIFGPQFDPDDVVRESWGAAVFTFGSCGDGDAAGNMRYVAPLEFGLEGNQFLYRLVSIDGLQCGFLTNTYNVSAAMEVAENIFLDGDVNDPNVPEESNDLDAPSAQQLVPPAKVAGFVTRVGTGVDRDRFATEIDEWDTYILAIRKGESVSLNISDWDSTDEEAVDLDLYLANVNDPGTTVDSSLSTNQTEWVTAPEDGNYFVMVQAFTGTSNYLLRSGQSAPVGVSRLSASIEMEDSEVIAALRPQNRLSSVEDQNGHKSRIQRVEKEHALTRIEEMGNGEILYSVDLTRIDRLVPHPLTLIGRGSITPEQWQVIRAAKTLSASPDYRWAGPNYIQNQMATPNDPNYGFQWHYPKVKLPQAWDITTGSKDVVVAVIDSGVHNHPDLANNVNYSLGYDFVSSILSSGDSGGIDSDARDPGETFPSFQDYLSHGTHVAGTVGATGNNGAGVTGVNWDVTIMPVRVLGTDGSGDCWGISQGMKWAGRLTNASGLLPAKQADVINMSLGGEGACPGNQELVNQLVAKGIVIVAAAGNANSSIPNYPASLSNVISVSATTYTDELAPYSSYGSGVDVAAPGGDASVDLNNDGYGDGVLSPTLVIEKGSATKTNSYQFLNGTSMAAPHIAGIAGLMKAVYPAMGWNEFFTAISSGKITVDLAQNGATNKDSLFGYGRIDAQKAVNWAAEQSQGQPGDAFLTTSISSANFGSNQASIDFRVEKAGSGAISVTGGGDTESWIQLAEVSIDGDGLGTYRITVSRAGLIGGTYSGWVAIDGSDGSRIWISVAMQVGEKVAGEAGYLYALLLDSWTFGNVKQWNGLPQSGEYLIDLESNPPGSYFLMIGSDIDNDFTVCDAGEFCQVYPLNSQASEIVITNGHVQLGSFLMTFPDDADDGGILSSAFGAATQEEAKNVQAIKARIGTTGISRK